MDADDVAHDLMLHARDDHHGGTVRRLEARLELVERQRETDVGKIDHLEERVARLERQVYDINHRDA